MQPKSPVYLCGPIAEPGMPAKGGYQSCNLRTIEALRRRGIEAHPLAYAQPGSTRVRKLFAYALGFSGLALKTAACKKYSIVHITGLRRPFLFPELALIYVAKMRKCHVIYDIRDGLELDLVWLERSAIYRYFFSRVLGAVDLVMVEGASQVPFVESHTGTTPTLLPNQIDLSEIPARPPAAGVAGMPVIAYAGALRREKGVSTILEAAEILAQRGFGVTVRIAGMGDEGYVEDLRTRFSHLAVEWLGPQTTAQVLDLFSTSHFFLFPTRWPGEGQSNALTEAMACGCVPIASDHGFNAATIGDSGGVVLHLEQTASDYAAAVQQIWDSGSWEEISHRSAALVRERFSSVVVIDHLCEQYAALERPRTD